MRTLIVGALAATLAGCSCFVSPQSGVEACTGLDARGFACFDRNAGGASRLSMMTEPEPSPRDTSIAAPKEKTAPAAKTAKASSAHSIRTTRHAGNTAKSTTAAAKVEPPASTQPAEAADPVVAKAKSAVAAKLE